MEGSESDLSKGNTTFGLVPGWKCPEMDPGVHVPAGPHRARPGEDRVQYGAAGAAGVFAGGKKCPPLRSPVPLHPICADEGAEGMLKLLCTFAAAAPEPKTKCRTLGTWAAARKLTEYCREAP
eukprot:gene17033-biopygen2293